MVGPNFLVRHGKDKQGTLTEQGVQQSEGAREELLSYGLGGAALLLSSDLSRAVQTAGIIGEGLGVSVHASRRIAVGGNNAEVVKDLDEFLDTTLEQMGLERADDQPLVVVTHAPMMAIAKGLSINDIYSVNNGEVVQYASGTWSGTYYSEGLECMYAEELGIE